MQIFFTSKSILKGFRYIQQVIKPALESSDIVLHLQDILQAKVDEVDPFRSSELPDRPKLPDFEARLMPNGSLTQKMGSEMCLKP